MKNKYIKEDKVILEKSEKEKRIELITNIVKAKRDIEDARRNFEFAEGELIDYYSYAIKACQSKLNYLIRTAKLNNISIKSCRNDSMQKFKVM